MELDAEKSPVVLISRCWRLPVKPKSVKSIDFKLFGETSIYARTAEINCFFDVYVFGMSFFITPAKTKSDIIF